MLYIVEMGRSEATEIGIRELRQHASQYVGMAAAGREFIVTNHGQPVARLTPITSTSDNPRQCLIDAGVLIPATDAGSVADLPLVKAAQDAPSTREILDDLRADRL